MQIELDDKDLRHIERMAGIRGWEITRFLKTKEVESGPKKKQAQQKPKAKSAAPKPEGAGDVDGQAADTGQLCLQGD